MAAYAAVKALQNPCSWYGIQAKHQLVKWHIPVNTEYLMFYGVFIQAGIDSRISIELAYNV